MTTTESGLETIRRDCGADLSTWRSVPDVIGAIQPDPQRPWGRVWDFTTTPNEHRPGPTLVVGIRHSAGFLRWHPGTEPGSLIPATATYTGQLRDDYEYRGEPFGYDAGEEIPVAYVYAAVAEFVTTGQRPQRIRWTTPPTPTRQVHARLASDPNTVAMPLAVDTPADIANVIRICRQHHRTLAELTDNRGHRLVAGLDAQRSVGVLALQEDPSQPELVPVAGTHNTVEYEDWYGSVLPSREVPIELVERAIREFHETDARPACVAWETPATA